MHARYWGRQIKVSVPWIISQQKATGSEVTLNSICLHQQNPVIMRRYWWVQVSCLMNSRIDPAAVPFDNDPPVSEPSFSRRTMGSSCEISHAVSAKHTNHRSKVDAVKTIFKITCRVVQKPRFSVSGNGCMTLLGDRCHKQAPPHFNIHSNQGYGV